MRFLVTGAGGFLGSNVVRTLLDRDHEVLALSSQAPEDIISRIGRGGGHSEIEHRRLEVAGNELLLDHTSLKGCDAVVNCAFPWNRDGLEMATGLEFHRNLVEVVDQSNIPTFVNVSSQSVYPSNRRTPATEKDPVNCHSPYTTAKYALELLTLAVLGEQRTLNARVSSLIGVGYDIRLVNRFVLSALQSRPIVIKGGEQLLDYMDVRDGANALSLLGEGGVIDRQNTINVGAGRPLRLLEIACRVRDVVEQETGLNISLEVEGDTSPQTNSALDCTSLEKLYGFRASIPIDSTIRWILEAFKAQRS